MGYRERLGFKSAMFGTLTIRAGFQEKNRPMGCPPARCRGVVSGFLVCLLIVRGRLGFEFCVFVVGWRL